MNEDSEDDEEKEEEESGWDEDDMVEFLFLWSKEVCVEGAMSALLLPEDDEDDDDTDERDMVGVPLIWTIGSTWEWEGFSNSNAILSLKASDEWCFAIERTETDRASIE